jgi:hypothetical protein
MELAAEALAAEKWGSPSDRRELRRVELVRGSEESERAPLALKLSFLN